MAANRRRNRAKLAAALFLAGLSLLSWGLWPARRLTRVLNIDAPRLGSIGRLGGDGESTARNLAPTSYRSVIEYPQWIRARDSDLVRLSLVPVGTAPANEPSGVSSASASLPIASGETPAQSDLIQAKLELDGATVRPEGELITPWRNGQEAGFVWEVSDLQGVTARGTAWTFLSRTDSPTLSGGRMALSAQPLEIRRSSIYGLAGPAARATGGALLVFGVVLGMPWLEAVLRRATAPRASRRG